MSAPTPADVRGALVVVLCSRRRAWSSQQLASADGEALLEQVSDKVAQIGDGSGLLGFVCGDGRRVWIRARDLESIELRNSTVAPHAGAIDPDQRFRPLAPELAAMTAEEIADAVVRQ